MQMNIVQKSKFYAALGEPVRLKMLQYMLKAKGCICICNLAKHIDRDQSVAFRHILVLKGAGIISTKKECRYLMCCVKNKAQLRKYMED